nr:nuclease-related domain-containing protein [Cellulomonas sp. Root485]
MIAVSEQPQSTTAWARGAKGEEQLGRGLDSLADRGVRLLHDRRIPRTRANIDHIAVAPSGVYVIDAKRYAGRPTLRVEGGVIRPRTSRLVIGSRDGTKLVEGVHKQVGLVRTRSPLRATTTSRRAGCSASSTQTGRCSARLVPDRRRRRPVAAKGLRTTDHSRRARSNESR